MRKLLILLGLVLGIGWGGTALAQSGSDSSGTHSYSVECVGEDIVATNTGAGTIRILFQLAFGSGGDELDAGESRNFGPPGGESGPVGNRYEIWFEDPDGSGHFVGLDEGNFPDCGATPPTTTQPPTTTAPPTTQPTEPTTPTPETPGLNPVSGEGYVAPGAEIGPGQATFGATGFAPGEEVGVTLFSTPRSLGTVTANDAGAASITFEVLASDGAGEHHVEFSGPSGSVSIPFTLVLPGQLPVTR